MPVIVSKTKAKGLFTAPNELSANPDGALAVGLNSVIDDEGILESRRGFVEAFSLPLGADRARRFGFYEDKIIVAYSGSGIGYYDGSSFTPYSGTYSDPDSTLARTRFTGANANLYFTTSAGLYKIDSHTATPALAGVPKGLDIALTVNGSSGFLSDQFAVAYRIIWGIKDANDNLIRGAPSGRAEFYNTAGGSRDVQIISTIPEGITASHFFQVYRSKDTDNTGTAIVPDDELGLIYEANPSATNLSNGYIDFIDIADEDLRGETLYTSPSQQGILQANDLPPLAWDITQFENQMVYANIESKQRQLLTIVATGGSTGIQSDDTLTIDGDVYTAKASETINSLEYALSTGGTPSQDIADTARSLVRVINRNTTNNSVYAYYLSGQDDLPGQLLIEERTLGGGTFYLTVSANGSAFNPPLPTSGTTIGSSNDDFQHYIMYSKNQQPEAVPLLNQIPVGSANDKILRVLALRNSLFIFKEREGIFRITGSDLANATAELFDSSARLLAPDSLAIVNNNIWGLSDQGEIRVSESGVSVTSRPIEDGVLTPTGTARAQMQQYSFGVGYETDRKYFLWAVTASTDTSAPISWVYNTFTESFTKWDRPGLCGGVNPADDKLYYGPPDSNSIFIERKTKDRTDFVDEAITTSIVSFVTTTIVLGSAEGVKVGDLLHQAADKFSVIETVSLSTATITVKDTITWSVAAVDVLKAIDVQIEWNPVFGQNPGTLKQFADFTLLLRKANFSSASLEFATDISPVYEAVSISGATTGAWGLFEWGGEPWGGVAVPRPIRTYVPLEKSRGSWLRVKFKHKEGYGDFQLNGFSLPYTDTESFKVVQ